ncbi:MAG: hypothetical protein WBG50_24275 [Desulfomonilaceae bacterium]
MESKVSMFRVFYAWQDDLPAETNQRLIREALRVASSRLEEEFSEMGLHVVLDEATRDTPGSPNIPLTVLQKVREADTFVGDITTINQDAPDGQPRVPNPNVIFELGYAIAQLGWNRTVMLFNESYGKFPEDVPFDIDRHRITRYRFGLSNPQEKKPTKNAVAALKEPLIRVLFEALKTIITHCPARPDDDLTPQQKKRRHDVRTLEDLLSTIYIPTLEVHIEEAPHIIHHGVFFYWECFKAAISSHLFHLYDEKLGSLVQDIYQSWGESLSYDQYYIPTGGNRYLFHMPGDYFRDTDQENAWHQAENAIHRLDNALSELLSYIRTDYLEIDPAETSERARNFRVDYLNKFNPPDAE